MNSFLILDSCRPKDFLTEINFCLLIEQSNNRPTRVPNTNPEKLIEIMPKII